MSKLRSSFPLPPPLRRPPDDGVRLSVEGQAHQPDFAVLGIAGRAFEGQGVRIAAAAVDSGEVFGDKFRLATAPPAGGGEEHLMKGGLAEGVERHGHCMKNMEHNMNKVKEIPGFWG